MSAADPADDDDKTLAGPPAAGRRVDAGPLGAGAAVSMAASGKGRELSPDQPGHTLPFGTRLRDYQITGLIGEGGFGIVYVAWDHSLQRRVAIKEYMPASMAARVNGSSAIVVKSERHLDTFRAGLKSFVNEARLLARFDHPSLVKVYRFWEENGTAYMVMPYYEGPTLKAALAALARPPNEGELRAWLQPLLDALAVMHAAQCFHRDIAPDNILLTPRGPLLLDFGAARRVIGDMTHAITVVLKPGYAPIEQYGEVASMSQGAWTDLYALASVVYFAIVGRTPTSSVERLMDDRLEPLAVTAAGRYSPAFLHAIDAALAVRPADRPQSERQFRALLDAGRATMPTEPAPLAAPTSLAPGADSGPAAGDALSDVVGRTVAERTVAERSVVAERTVPERTVPERTVAERTLADRTVPRLGGDEDVIAPALPASSSPVAFPVEEDVASSTPAAAAAPERALEHPVAPRSTAGPSVGPRPRTRTPLLIASALGVGLVIVAAVVVLRPERVAPALTGSAVAPSGATVHETASAPVVAAPAVAAPVTAAPEGRRDSSAASLTAPVAPAPPRR